MDRPSTSGRWKHQGAVALSATQISAATERERERESRRPLIASRIQGSGFLSLFVFPKSFRVK